ncbi:MAG: CAP domain-containing protein [Acidimicrobiales bacterium]|mgnify:FL=1|nr:CAP domain-containing protein [Acidimicrobiales bacterium]
MAISSPTPHRAAPRPGTRTRPTPRRAALAAVAVIGALTLSGCWGSTQHKELDFINWSRGTNGLAAVNGDSQLMAKAQAWSEHMARTGRLEHTGGGNNLDPSGIHNWCGVAENVAYNASSFDAHQAFMKSPPHRRNVLGDYDRVGTGVARKGNTVWVTEIYVRSC